MCALSLSYRLVMKTDCSAVGGGRKKPQQNSTQGCETSQRSTRPACPCVAGGLCECKLDVGFITVRLMSFLRVMRERFVYDLGVRQLLYGTDLRCMKNVYLVL
ncbi:hypothetical protein CEXT_283101 [Caerostris extrusa]|uniref:Uncharacterized protein n=1 Tax=Caerostris extrusa TaxID=172846 RepID=A0AAV4Y9U7_CAEEX|nr:hypothetical protein CEXT_283101 [Caerostris extrusa]